jgi:hypothetical protein
LRTAPLALVLSVSMPQIARAEIERYALIAGNNQGARDEARLRYAEDDADRIASVLGDLGGFLPENTVLLKGKDAASLRRALITLNDRIRSRSDAPGIEPLLFVFYSGHADARALHLGDSEIDLAEVEKLVRGSAAAFRLLVIDACRSGALTQVKGGSSAPPFPIRIDQRLEGRGVAFMTSSAATEDAQESEALRGSFFTHYFALALIGAADSNGDGRVDLDEAYRFAYENTLRASSRTLAGTQHPTYQYELHGRGDVVLTSPFAWSPDRASLTLPEGRASIVFLGSADGPVIAEVGVDERARRISVKPGRYFIRSRGRDFLLEGALDLAAGTSASIDDARLERIEYARLVRKGEGMVTAAQGPELGYRVRTPLWSGASVCHGPYVGWAIDLESLSIVPRLGACRSTFENEIVSARADEIDLEVRAVHAFDVSRVTFELGLSGGGGLLLQRFSTTGVAPTRSSFALEAGAIAGVRFDLPLGLNLGLDVAGLLYVFRQENAAGDRSFAPTAASRLAASLGKTW